MSTRTSLSSHPFRPIRCSIDGDDAIMKCSQDDSILNTRSKTCMGKVKKPLHQKSSRRMTAGKWKRS